MNRWLFNSIVFGAVLHFFLEGQVAGQPLTSNQARLIAVTGHVAVRSSSATRTLDLNSVIEIGDEVTTDSNAEATIQTESGATIHVFPDSRLLFTGQPSPVTEFLHLLFGSIKVHVEKFSGRPNPHSMTTPTAVIAVRGTTFSVFVDDANATLVAVDEGLVAVANRARPNDEELLTAGQRTWVRGSLRPLRAQAFSGPSERADMMAANRNGMAAAMANGSSSMPSAMATSRATMSGAGMPAKTSPGH